MTPETPALEEIVIIQREAKNSKIIFPCSPIPNQIITNGIRASGGTGLINSTIGSNHPRNQPERPIAYPKGIPIKAPAKNPTTTRSSDQPKCSNRLKFLYPSDAIFVSLDQTASGEGSQTGCICQPLYGVRLSVPLAVI